MVKGFVSAKAYVWGQQISSIAGIFTFFAEGRFVKHLVAGYPSTPFRTERSTKVSVESAEHVPKAARGNAIGSSWILFRASSETSV